MAVNISAWSIKKPLASVVLMLVLMVLGAINLSKLPITRLPNVDLPVVLVIISQFGAAASDLETQVAKPVEDAVSGVEGVRHIASSVNDGVSVTTITFGLETDPARGLNDVKDAVTRIRSDLPSGITEPQVRRVDVMGLGIVTYAAISRVKTPEQLSWFVDDVVKRSLQGVRGVGRIDRIGGVDREIVVRLDPDRLDAVGLTAADVSLRLRGNNVDLAGGRAEIGGRDQSIRTLAGAKTLAELAATMIALPMGGELRLDDLGSVTDTVAEKKTFARLDGEPVVAFSVLRSKGASDVTVAGDVEKRIEQISKDNPDVTLKVIDSAVDYTRGNYDSAMHGLYEGAALAVIVVLVFLRDIRATIVAAVTLPLSILPTFWVLSLLGFTLNLVSLLAITLSTGILVDDAIVEIENIIRHIRMGKSAYQAALEAADEIGLAVIAISLTIVAVFVPVSFMGGVAGQFFKQFGITVSVAVLFSLLIARLVTPMLAAYFFKSHAHEEKAGGFILRTYARVLGWSVRNRFITIAVGLLLFVASIWSMTLLPLQFLPAQDTGRSLLAVELPSGSVLTETEAVTEEIARRLHRRPEVRSVFVDGGRIPNGGDEVRKAALIINYTPKSTRKLTQRQLEQDINRDLQDIPDIRYWMVDDNGLRAISRIVSGADGAVVENVAAEMATQMKRIPILTNVVSTASLDRPELRIRPRADLASRLGVSTTQLSDTIRIATIGDVGPALAKFVTGDRQVPIRVQLEDSARADRQTLERLKVPTPRGGGVPLLTITDMEFGQGPISVSRYERNRQAKVEADLVGNAVLSEANKLIEELPVYKNPPPGVKILLSNDAEELQELLEGFVTAMGYGLVVVFAVLVLLFHSFLQPITILFSLPLSIGGAILGLLLTGRPLSVPVFIGILMLMGIVTKNAIMLVDFGLESMAKGMDRTAAIIDAGEKRARPIVMTTAAMVAGMLPSALAIGDGGEFRSPMAIAVMGGLIVSTFLSLLFVPALFTLMDDVGRILGWIFGRFVGKADEPAPAPGHHVPMIDAAAGPPVR